MPTIYAIDRPLLWAVTQSNAVLASGLAVDRPGVICVEKVETHK